MTKQETTKILAILEAHVPGQFEKISNETKGNMLSLWSARFLKCDYETVSQAVMNYIDNDVWGKLPPIGAIKEELRKIQYPDELTEQEAVNMILDRLNWRSAREAYDSLPPILQKVVGSSSQLVTWGYLEVDTVQSVISSNIQRSLRALLEREREKQRTGQTKPQTDNLIEGEKEQIRQIEQRECASRTDEEQKAINLEGIRRAKEALKHVQEAE